MHIEIIQWVVASQSNVMKTSQLIKHILTVPFHTSVGQKI